MGFSMAARLTVPGFDVVNRAGRAGWQGSGQAGRQAGRQAGAVNGISGTVLVKLKRASSCLFHTKRQLTPQLMSIDIDCQTGSAYRRGPFCVCLTLLCEFSLNHTQCLLSIQGLVQRWSERVLASEAVCTQGLPAADRAL